MSTEPKTVERRIAFRKANRCMTRRRIDLPAEQIDYKNTDILSKFTSETGKILPRRVTGVSAKLHRKITREIKRARSCNLLP
ncbi:30S ribosomal protein S18 [Rubritalea marina]|uniref:30S ribosomal protein S18 n=1 Tax=Rubritalea marina TaxID=361055 RepID=UPI00038044AC